jgi:Domain of unknown function (DUF4037)
VASGIELARAYHRDIVGPLLRRRWPELPYAAARLGSGSDVLGYDDLMSQDHDWGLRLNVLVPVGVVEEVDAYLNVALPESYAGWPTRFATTWRPDAASQVQVDSTRSLAVSRLGVDPRDGLDPLTWLGLTGQSILEVTGGAVFHDSAGQLGAVREALRWYPDDVWRYVLAADWSRLGEEIPLAGRAGHRSDEVGSRVVMARLVRTAMHLGFLLERVWPPYAKWLGTSYARLTVAGPTTGLLSAALDAPDWGAREDGLTEALEVLLMYQSALGMPTPKAATEPFWDRPFRAVAAQIPPLLVADVTDPRVKDLPPGVGAVEQWADSVAVLGAPHRRLAAAAAALAPADGQLRSTEA